MSNMNAQSAQPQPPREVAFSLPHALYSREGGGTEWLCCYSQSLLDERENVGLPVTEEALLEFLEDYFEEPAELNAPASLIVGPVTGRWLKKKEREDIPRDLPICTDLAATLAVLSRVRGNTFRPKATPQYRPQRLEKGIFVMETDAFEACHLDGRAWPREAVEPEDEGFPRCPYCRSDDGCKHLVMDLDRTFSGAQGGTFYDGYGVCMSLIGATIAKLRKTGTLAEAVERADDCAEGLKETLEAAHREDSAEASVADNITGDDTEDGHDGDEWDDECIDWDDEPEGRGPVWRYLDQLLWDNGAVSIYYEHDGSMPGTSYAGEVYYSTRPKTTARDTVKAVRADCRLLLGK